MRIIIILLGLTALSFQGTKIIYDVKNPVRYTLHHGENRVIHHYVEQGVSLGQKITYHTQHEQNPCQLLPQELKFANTQQQSLLHLIPEFTVQGFADAYKEGQLTTQMPQIVAVTFTTYGAIVLTNEGGLKTIDIEEDVRQETIQASIRESYIIDREFCSSPNIQMAFTYGTNNLFIFGETQVLVKEIGSLHNVFTEHYHSLYLEDVVQVRSSDWYVYAATCSGVVIQYFDGKKLWKLRTIPVHRPQEIRITQIQPGLEVLLVLDEKVGVKMYHIMYLIDDHMRLDVMEMVWTIGQPGGRYFDVWENSLILAVEMQGNYQVVRLIYNE